MGIIFGELVFEERKYHFEFEDSVLQMHEFGSEAISNPAQAFSEIIRTREDSLQTDSLVGICYPDGHGIVFWGITEAGTKNNVRMYRIRQYIEYKKHLEALHPFLVYL